MFKFWRVRQVFRRNKFYLLVLFFFIFFSPLFFLCRNNYSAINSNEPTTKLYVLFLGYGFYALIVYTNIKRLIDSKGDYDSQIVNISRPKLGHSRTLIMNINYDGYFS